jgi:hypothetical protein
VGATVRRIRDSAHASWVDALTPVLAPHGDEDGKAMSSSWQSSGGP